MRKLLPLLLCLSLSIFTVARAMKRTNTLAPDNESSRKAPMKQSADVKPLIKHPNTEEEPGSSDNENPQDASGDDGEDVNDNDAGDAGDAGDAAADEDTGDDNGADDDAGDDGGDNGGQ